MAVWSDPKVVPRPQCDLRSKAILAVQQKPMAKRGLPLNEKCVVSPTVFWRVNECVAT